METLKFLTFLAFDFLNIDTVRIRIITVSAMSKIFAKVGISWVQIISNTVDQSRLSKKTFFPGWPFFVHSVLSNGLRRILKEKKTVSISK